MNLVKDSRNDKPPTGGFVMYCPLGICTYYSLVTFWLLAWVDIADRYFTTRQGRDGAPTRN